MKYVCDKEELVILRMIKNKVIPETSVFQITEDLINLYITEYSALSQGNNKFSKRFARKLAGLTLLKLNFARGATFKTIRAGLVYVISNPAWPEFLKVGMTIDIPSRLAGYQVYDPLQQYKVETYEFVLDRISTERNILGAFNIHVESGEWLKINDAQKIIQCVRDNRYIA